MAGRGVVTAAFVATAAFAVSAALALASAGCADPPGPASPDVDQPDTAPDAAPDAAPEVTKAPEPLPGVQVRMDFAALADDFYAAPFPSEARRRPDGGVTLAAFPNPGEVALVEQLRTLLTRDADGFGLTSGVFFALDGEVDQAGLPDLQASLSAQAPVFLVDVDPASPRRGQRVPVRVAFQADGGPFGAPHLLSLVPLQGLPMRPDTLYAAVVLRALGDTTGAPLGRSLPMAQLLAGVRPDGLSAPAFDAYRQALDALALPDDALAGLAVFRTGDPAAALGAYVQHALEAGPPAPTLPPEAHEVFADFCVYQTTLQVPVYQAGESPYLEAGGGWATGPDGAPQVQGTAPSRLVVTVPRRPMPPDGYPVVVFVRTGGGGDRPLVDRGVRAEPGGPAVAPGTGPARYFADVGWAGVSWDGPHGGPRNVSGQDEQFLMFNFLNPDALRDNVRQSALEAALVAHLLDELTFDGSGCPGADTGGAPVRFDVTRVALMGHSMGATIAPLAAAVEPRFRAVLLSGAGGSYLENVLHKRKPLDVKPLAELLLGYGAEGRSLTEHDPVLSLLQWAGEPADPPVYAAAVQAHVLMLQGIVDSYILPPIANATSVSLGLDLAGPALDAAHPALAHLTPLADLLPLSGAQAIALPAAGNRPGGRTAVVVQHPADAVEDGHEAVFQTEPPKHQYRCFLAGLAAAPSAGQAPPVLPGAAALAPCD